MIPKDLIIYKRYYKDRTKVNFYGNKYDAISNCDAMLLLTEWKEFRSPDFIKMKNSMKRNLYL